MLNCAKDDVTSIKRPGNTKKHSDCMIAVNIQKDRHSLPKFAEKESSTTVRARKSEIMIAFFIAQNDLSFALSDQLTELIKKLDLEDVRKKLSCFERNAKPLYVM